ncbi:hypothetical protein IWZ01DRAFT_232739 [Phyllosticta capitalensis]
MVLNHVTLSAHGERTPMDPGAPLRRLGKFGSKSASFLLHSMARWRGTRRRTAEISFSHWVAGVDFLLFCAFAALFSRRVHIKLVLNFSLFSFLSIFFEFISPQPFERSQRDDCDCLLAALFSAQYWFGGGRKLQHVCVVAS